MKDERTFRILIANHQEEDLNYLHNIIAEVSDASMDLASSAKDAVLFIDYHAYDLIVANSELPGMEHEMLINYIYQSFLNSNTRIVFLCSGKHEPHTNAEKLRKVVFDIIDKPLQQVDLKHLFQLYFRFIQRERESTDQLQKEVQKRELLGLELEKSKENFLNIVEKGNAGILIMDKDGVIVFVNELGQQIFLRKKEELLGTTFGVFINDDQKTEIAIVRKNGELGIGEIAAARTQWKNQPAQLILINDITEHKQLQEHLIEAREKAQESDRLKTAFLANMSHEIRTPLNCILGFSQLMDVTNLDNEKKSFFLTNIVSCGNHLLEIISDIIDISQIESGQLKISKSEFNVIESMDEIYDVFRSHKKIISNDIQLILNNPEVKNLTIYSDPARFRQILVNLINNAIKFTDSGFIEVGFNVEKKELTFYVKDSGIGIPLFEFENIFQRFRQVIETKNRLNEGNGLGLSISKALVELLGGKIWLESTLNEGSVFYFTIPVKAETTLIPKQLVSQNLFGKPELKNKKILVVEDDEINFLFIQSIIKDWGTIIIWAKDGMEAVNITKNEKIDLILMDMKLPVMSGYEATREIRLMYPDIPIIAQTAYAMGGDKDKVLAAGCNDYITKPIKVNDLIFKMNTYFN